MSRNVRIAALQLRAHDRAGFERVLPVMLEEVRRAAQGCDLLVLAEGTIPAYVLGNAPVDESTLARSQKALSAIARELRCVIVAGTALRRDDALYNSALVFDADGRIAGSAEKIFLWHFDRRWFSAGSSIEPVDTAAGRLGVLICADGRMPAIARGLVDRGAELLVMPTAWVTSGRDPAALENIQADLLARVRAFENGVPFVAANKCGTELGMVAYCGKSQIVDAAGTVIALASQTRQETIGANIALAPARPNRADPPEPPRRAVNRRSLRIAFTCDALGADLTDRLDVLEADLALSALGNDHFDRFDDEAGAVRTRSVNAFDPGYLLAYRRAGYRAAVLDAAETHPWLERIARARAAELRMYVVVFDRAADRAYAIDPDGAVVAGTFDDFRFACFAFDPARAALTLVAPGTDVAEGIERVHALVHVPAR